MYICKPDVEFCKEEAPWLFKNTTVTDANGFYSVSLNVSLESGKRYKVSIVSKRGYAETVVSIG
ncbi:MAG: hypothetical protein GXO63_00745 [Candidatus Micrarchaeota archaeon]|nr:hypothetical protein [Candidatus Micrarchaeota archaeon]